MYRYNNETNSSKPEKTYTIDLTGTWISKVFMFMFSGKMLKAALIFMSIMGTLFFIGEYRTSKKYTEIVAVNINNEICLDTGYCDGEYEYIVNGIKYYAHYDNDRDHYNKYAKVYYNPNNPSEYMMFSNWHVLIFGSLGILLIIEFFERKVKSYMNNADKKSSSKPIGI